MTSLDARDPPPAHRSPRCATPAAWSRAAQLLHLTQSALSHQLQALEEHYGVALFERKSVPPQFTPAGQRLLRLARRRAAAVEEAERDVARLAQGSGGSCASRVECHTCFDWLMPAMDEFRQRWPEVELDIVSGFHPDPIALLLQDRAEVAIVVGAAIARRERSTTTRCSASRSWRCWRNDHRAAPRSATSTPPTSPTRR